MNKLFNVVMTVSVVIVFLTFIPPATLGLKQQLQTDDISSNKPPQPCYGPCITANVSSNQVLINQEVTIVGEICPPADNVTIRVTFTRPDYTWIDRYVVPDNQTGLFTVTQKLDMAGFWNIFPIYGHISDRLYVNVTDPNPQSTPVTPNPLPPFKLNYAVFVAAGVSLGVGVVALAVGTRNKTRKISGLRFFVQVLFVFLIFFGVFIDHQNIPVPAEQIAPHEFLIGTDTLGPLPDGLPIPVFGCWYPCGRTITCPLWQMQTYIYPFWNVGHGWGVDYILPGLERLAIVFGIVILASVLLGRWWCGWVCPFGLYLDVVTRIRKALKIKHRDFSKNFNEKFHQFSYVILALLLLISVVFGAQAIAGTQLVPGTENGGFVYQYLSAPFCQVCPMKPLCLVAQGSLGVIKWEWMTETTKGDFWQLGQYLTSLNIAILLVVTAAAFFFRRSWCRICPLGGLIALFNRFPPFKWISGVRLEKVEEKCTKCGVCKRVCPTQVTEVYEAKGGDVTTSQCLLCLRCVEMCPEEGCLKFKLAGKTICKSRNWLNSKSFNTSNKEGKQEDEKS